MAKKTDTTLDSVAMKLVDVKSIKKLRDFFSAYGMTKLFVETHKDEYTRFQVNYALKNNKASGKLRKTMVDFYNKHSGQVTAIKL